MKPALASNIPFLQFDRSARFFEVEVYFHGQPSSCFRVAADCEGDVRQAIHELAPYVKRNAHDIKQVNIRETPRFKAALIRNVN